MLAFEAAGFAAQNCPSLAGVPRIKERCADFVVEEIPAYAPSGQGAHLFVWLQKEGLSAEGLHRHVARTLGVDPQEISAAGLKDSRAITRQTLCVPGHCQPKIEALNSHQVQVLSYRLHGNKLKTGHLKGNRFTIRVPDQSADNARRAAIIAQHLSQRGLANFYGPQRFGGGETLALGLSLLAQGAKAPLRGRRISRLLRRLALSSVQSALFNRVLAARLAAGELHRVLCGDVCLVRASGGPFVSDDPQRETARLAAQEIVTAGPMFGPKMRPAQGAALTRELAALEAAHLKGADFSGFGKLLRGSRRANLVWPQHFRVSHAEDGALIFDVCLPPGSYATTLLREFWRDAAAVWH